MKVKILTILLFVISSFFSCDAGQDNVRTITASQDTVEVTATGAVVGLVTNYDVSIEITYNGEDTIDIACILNVIEGSVYECNGICYIFENLDNSWQVKERILVPEGTYSTGEYVLLDVKNFSHDGRKLDISFLGNGIIDEFTSFFYVSEDFIP